MFDYCASSTPTPTRYSSVTLVYQLCVIVLANAESSGLLFFTCNFKVFVCFFGWRELEKSSASLDAAVAAIHKPWRADGRRLE